VRLTVLGGSAAGVNTGAGCSGYLLESTSTRIVLDLGPGTLLELRKHTDFRRLDGIVISHFHLDHVLDVAALRFSLAYNPIAPPSPIPLWLPPGGQAQLRAFASAFAEPGEEDAFFSRVFDVEEYDPRQGLEIGDFQLRFQPTVHYIPCWAIRVSSADGSTDLGYTADTGPATPLADFFAGVDAVTVVARFQALQGAVDLADQLAVAVAGTQFQRVLGFAGRALGFVAWGIEHDAFRAGDEPVDEVHMTLSLR